MFQTAESDQGLYRDEQAELFGLCYHPYQMADLTAGQPQGE